MECDINLNLFASLTDAFGLQFEFPLPLAFLHVKPFQVDI
jgi:hypothetical protein